MSIAVLNISENIKISILIIIKKPEFLIIGTKQLLSKISPCHLTIGSATVSLVNSAIGIVEREWIRALPSKITLTKRVELLTFRYTTSGTSESF